MKSHPFLRATRIEKSYGRNKVLAQAEINLEQGGIYGIVGENGSGKTTMMKILAGYMLPDKGRVFCSGKKGFCPQEPWVFRNLTISENIQFFSRAYGMNLTSRGKYGDAHIDHIANTFRMPEHPGVVCKKMSGGTLQKLNLVLALLHDPDIILLDEPYSAFDWETYLSFWDYALDQRTKGKIIVIVSHLLYDQDKIDGKWKIDKGKLVCD
jgi:ABC-type multidrug transport system ATPase subunit